MHGLINRSIEDLVRGGFGDDVWERIKARAGVEVEVFVSDQQYPEQMTFDLVAAASEELGLPPEGVLEAFGRHWVLKTAREGYSDLLEAAGKTLPEFLRSLPDFHSRVLLILPDLVPPDFEVHFQGDQLVELHYISKRPGLTALARGMILGLGEMFSTPIDVELVQSRDTGAPHDVFRIAWTAKAAA